MVLAFFALSLLFIIMIVMTGLESGVSASEDVIGDLYPRPCSFLLCFFARFKYGTSVVGVV